MTLIKVATGPRRLVQLESEGDFAVAMQQADSGPGDQRRRLKGVIYVSDNRVDWREWMIVFDEVWRPEFQGGLPQLEDRDITELAKPSGARYAEFRWTSNLGYRMRPSRR